MIQFLIHKLLVCARSTEVAWRVLLLPSFWGGETNKTGDVTRSSSPVLKDDLHSPPHLVLGCVGGKKRRNLAIGSDPLRFQTRLIDSTPPREIFSPKISVCRTRRILVASSVPLQLVFQYIVKDQSGYLRAAWNKIKKTIQLCCHCTLQVQRNEMPFSVHCSRTTLSAFQRFSPPHPPPLFVKPQFLNDCGWRGKEKSARDTLQLPPRRALFICRLILDEGTRRGARADVEPLLCPPASLRRTGVGHRRGTPRVQGGCTVTSVPL